MNTRHATYGGCNMTRHVATGCVVMTSLCLLSLLGGCADGGGAASKEAEATGDQSRAGSRTPILEERRDENGHLLVEVCHKYIVNDSDLHESRQEKQTEYLGDMNIFWTVVFDDETGTIVGVDTKRSYDRKIRFGNEGVQGHSKTQVSTRDSRDIATLQSYVAFSWAPVKGGNSVYSTPMFGVSQSTTIRVVTKQETGKYVLKWGKGTPVNPYPSKEKARDNIGGGVHTPDVFVITEQKAEFLRSS